MKISPAKAQAGRRYGKRCEHIKPDSSVLAFPGIYAWMMASRVLGVKKQVESALR